MESIPNIVRIAHCVFAVRDLQASRYFYVDLLGLNVLHETATSLYLRGVEDREWVLKLEQDSTPRVRQIGYKVWSDEELIKLATLADSQGLAYRWEKEHDRPHLLRVQDPFGFPLAFYFQSVRHPWLLQDFHLHRGPAIQRVDHANIFTPKLASAVDWYRTSLGFKLTEYSADDQGRMAAAWTTRKGSVHDLAFTGATGPRLHHFAFWMPEAAKIFQTCDIFAGARMEKHLERGPGRHGITNAFFLYLRDPDGHRIELFTSDYYAGDPDLEPIRWSLDDARRQQLWGGIAPKSWFTEGTAVEGFDGVTLPLEESELPLPAYIR
jgi:catechol 2,3-dioxygenase